MEEHEEVRGPMPLFYVYSQRSSQQRARTESTLHRLALPRSSSKLSTSPGDLLHARPRLLGLSNSRFGTDGSRGRHRGNVEMVNRLARKQSHRLAQM